MTSCRRTACAAKIHQTGSELKSATWDTEKSTSACSSNLPPPEKKSILNSVCVAYGESSPSRPPTTSFPGDNGVPRQEVRENSPTATQILLFLGLLLPVTSDSETSSPSSTPEPAPTEPLTTTASHAPGADQTTDGGPHVSSKAEPELGIGEQTTAAVDNEVPNATEADSTTSVSAIVTTLLSDTKATTTESPTTSTAPATSRRSMTTLRSSTHAGAKNDSARWEHDQIFLYDYPTLRQWGLICALLLCIIGFLVLFSGRCRGFSCKRRQRRKYNITGL